MVVQRDNRVDLRQAERGSALRACRLSLLFSRLVRAPLDDNRADSSALVADSAGSALHDGQHPPFAMEGMMQIVLDELLRYWYSLRLRILIALDTTEGDVGHEAPAPEWSDTPDL